MINELISKQLRKKIASLPSEKNSIIVLKGISLNVINDVDLDSAKDNPLNYFMRLTNDG